MLLSLEVPFLLVVVIVIVIIITIAFLIFLSLVLLIIVIVVIIKFLFKFLPGTFILLILLAGIFLLFLCNIMVGLSPSLPDFHSTLFVLNIIPGTGLNLRNLHTPC